LGAYQLISRKRAGYRRALTKYRTRHNRKLVRSGTELIIINSVKKVKGKKHEVKLSVKGLLSFF
jgi:hypothetical protein